MKHEYTESALDALPEPEPPTVDWKAKFEALESQWVVAERAVDNVLQILPELKRSPSWEDAAALIREYIDSANARAEKAEAELARVREACDRMSEQEVSSLSQLRPLAEAAEPADPYAELKAAHAAGKIIEQIGHGSSDWFGCGSSIAWSRPPECYRIKPEPKTFEAHGKTWTHHTPGDPMPCDGELKIYCIGNTKGVTHGAYPANWWAWSKQSCIIGWRYADDPLVTKPISLPLAESMSLRDWFAGQALAGSDEFSQILSMSVYKIADAMLKAREVKP